MSMVQVAELGYFPIKYIEDFKLTQTLGVDNKHPQIHFIPDYKQDYLAAPEQVEHFKHNATNRLKKHEADLIGLFK